MNVLTVKLWGEELGRLVWDQVRKTNYEGRMAPAKSPSHPVKSAISRTPKPPCFLTLEH